MSNREMLELAAKAAGIVGDYYCDEYSEGIYTNDENDCGYGWSPHLDDGQVLRLAVKCGININMDDCSAYIRLNDTSMTIIEEYWGGDYDPCYRLAIVKVAAEIGKGMRL